MYHLRHNSLRNLLTTDRNLLQETCILLTLSFSSSSSSTITTTSIYQHNYDHLLRCCDNLNTLQQIHSSLLTSGDITNNPHLTAQLIIHYSNYNDPISARSLFDLVAGHKSFLWNTMLRGYGKNNHSTETLHLYLLMRRTHISPNNYTFPFVLKACAFRSSPSEGKAVHGDVLKSGFQSDVFVQAALMHMYANCGEVDDARRVFDGMPVRDLVSSTAMITAYEQSEQAEEALLLLLKMQEEEGFVVDSVATVSIAAAVAQLGDVRRARSVHAHAIRNKFVVDLFVENAVVGMYAKCGNLEEARLVFDRMEKRDVISWNSMLSGYVQNGRASEAMSLFEEMKVPGGAQVKPNSVTALIMVSACAYLGSMHLGKKLHQFITSIRIEIDTTLWNALLDMYAKCGDLDTTVQMFHTRVGSELNVSSWNVMISAHGMHGHGKEALQLFAKMREQGVEPNHITFTSLLSACSHSGLIEEGRKCFQDMENCSVTPELKHYACMVDMLGRAGLLDEAYELINKMPIEPNDWVWGALLLACRIHRNTKLGEVAATKLFHLEPEHAGYYVLMSNIYAASSKWQEVGRLRQDMKSRQVKKTTAFSVIEYGKEVHWFHAGDQIHPHRKQVYAKVESLIIEMRMVGYNPDRACALHDLEEEDIDHVLKSHCEKLAVAFGVMNVEPGLPIQVTMNLRVCNDCHLVFKFISSVYQRKIILRDSNRFHHFQNGLCSCNDYW